MRSKKRKGKKPTIFHGKARYDDWDIISQAQRKYRTSLQRERTWEIRKILLTDHMYICKCCKRLQYKDNMTIDHIIPISRGGKTVMRNVQIICLECNKTKADFDIFKEKWA